jgi:uncharacterized Zn-binding protein involved in type VI secretion
MTKREFILKGDTTTHGGTVITAWGEDGPAPFHIDGIPIACVGDKVFCPHCKGVYTIIEGATNSPVCGKQMALNGCRVSCGAQVLAVQQHHSTHESDAGELPALERAIARSAAERAGPKTAPVQAGEVKTERFCLKCWLKSLERRNALMPEPM